MEEPSTLRLEAFDPEPSLTTAGSYGLGPWYFDMEERLHNPYFIGGRAWNGPIEGWVGKNKVRVRVRVGPGFRCAAQAWRVMGCEVGKLRVWVGKNRARSPQGMECMASVVPMGFSNDRLLKGSSKAQHSPPCPTCTAPT